MQQESLIIVLVVPKFRKDITTDYRLLNEKDFLTKKQIGNAMKTEHD